MKSPTALMPWWLKIAVKIALSRLPVPYAFWKRFGIFDHGTMDDGAYAFGVFSRHFEMARPGPDFHCLELGPGDSVATALVARAFGAARTWLVDTGAYASTRPLVYERIRAYVTSKGMGDLPDFRTFDELLAASNAIYLTGGLSSLRTIPDASVDFIFSQAVLEHVRLADLDGLLRELRRIVRPFGTMTHQVDLKDHIAESRPPDMTPGDTGQ